MKKTVIIFLIFSSSVAYGQQSIGKAFSTYKEVIAFIAEEEALVDEGIVKTDESLYKLALETIVDPYSSASIGDMLVLRPHFFETSFHLSIEDSDRLRGPYGQGPYYVFTISSSSLTLVGKAEGFTYSMEGISYNKMEERSPTLKVKRHTSTNRREPDEVLEEKFVWNGREFEKK